MALVKCVRLDDYGRGIAYIDEKIVFVPNLLPLEEADIKIILSKKKYAVGEILSLEKQSPYRVKSKCPFLNCGCGLKHLKYEKQLEYKRQKVVNIMKKYVKSDFKINEIVPSNKIFGYRNKVTLKVNEKLGFHENNSNKVICIDRCDLVSEKVNEIIKVLNGMDLSNVREVVIKEFDGFMVIIDGFLRDISLLKPLVSSIYVNDKLVYGDEFIKTEINGLLFNVSKDSFFQVNSSTVKKLYDLVIKYCGDDYDKKVLDLYSGTGTISLLLSKYFKSVTGIEINKEAVLCANMNKKLNEIKNVNFICGDASKEIKKLDADIVVVDPPRSGLTEVGIKNILKINPSKIVYVSCDPITLARDLNILKDFYNIEKLTPVDMFPNTYHVECVCLLERKRTYSKLG